MTVANLYIKEQSYLNSRLLNSIEEGVVCENCSFFGPDIKFCDSLISSYTGRDVAAFPLIHFHSLSAFLVIQRNFGFGFK